MKTLFAILAVAFLGIGCNNPVSYDEYDPYAEHGRPVYQSIKYEVTGTAEWVDIELSKYNLRYFPHRRLPYTFTFGPGGYANTYLYLSAQNESDFRESITVAIYAKSDIPNAQWILIRKAQSTGSYAVATVSSGERTCWEDKTCTDDYEIICNSSNSLTMVYRTRYGYLYHQNGCRYLRQSKIALTLGEAVALELIPDRNFSGNACIAPLIQICNN